MCVSISSTIYPKHFLFYEKIQHDIIKVHRSSCKVPINSCQILMKINFRYIFQKNPQVTNFIRIYPVGAELFLANGWTDRQTRKKLEVAFHNPANVPKNAARAHTHAHVCFGMHVPSEVSPQPSTSKSPSQAS
jgi:hypothetical protein